jgi:hypothetical protein
MRWGLVVYPECYLALRVVWGCCQDSGPLKLLSPIKSQNSNASIATLEPTSRHALEMEISRLFHPRICS